MPRKVVDGYMQMPDPWRHVEGSRSEHRYDMQVLHPVLDLDYAPSQLIGNRWVHSQVRRGFALDADVRCGPKRETCIGSWRVRSSREYGGEIALLYRNQPIALRCRKQGSGSLVQGSNPEHLMSASGQKQTLHRSNVMSALPPKADIAGRRLDVRFVPKADIRLIVTSKRKTPGYCPWVVVGSVSHCDVRFATESGRRLVVTAEFFMAGRCRGGTWRTLPRPID
jgi:hypothetical protein